MAFVDLDAGIEARIGQSIRSFFEDQGEAAFRRVETEALRGTAAQSGVVVAVGGGALTSASNLKLARTHGCVVYLYATPDCLARRLLDDHVDRPMLRGDDGGLLSDDGLRARIADLLRKREPFYRQAHATVAVGDRTVPAAVEAVLEALRWFEPAR
jgi:shikimate kinase